MMMKLMVENHQILVVVLKSKAFVIGEEVLKKVP